MIKTAPAVSHSGFISIITLPPVSMPRVAAASFVGGLLEWYDFYIFAIGEGALEIAYADADVIDPLDCDGLGRCELRVFVDTGHLISEAFRVSGAAALPRCAAYIRFIVAHSEHAAIRLGPGPGT